MQKLLEDIKKAMEQQTLQIQYQQQEEMEKIVALEENEESETESEVESGGPKVEPVMEKSEPTTDPLDSDTDEPNESIDEKIPCDAEPIPSIETITEDSEEGHVVIIEPATESQPIEDLENQIQALKANDVDKSRRLPPPSIQDESPPFFLLPPRSMFPIKISNFHIAEFD
ncbi:unnamed protein product [Cuscuta campestris]|uniref:Uncharacterized protein n=1 Tax=Cuscuta campestris TaxID=132261 RepID=A0A484MS27_9ASTE|nr:unnamed protein product [Cuscuta campestris]